jgi:class 3 adenylate cyclase/predicted ATPase
MQVCPACGRENPEGFRHCGFCGAALSAPAVERRKLATLVFCDVAGSTAMGERVDPEVVRGLMRAYFAEVRGVLERHGGTVEKFIGDAVVAAFGVPHVHEDDALRACRAALEIQSLVSELKLRIGVNTGEVVSGDPSARESFVTGDAVNVAARLEQAAPPGGVLIGESTYRLVRDAVTVEAVEPLVAKGKSEPLAAYRLLEVVSSGSPSRRASPLVGRGEELALLEREFDAAVAERRCRLVTIVGEAGVGKSRLAAELTGRIDPHARVVRGACLSYGEGITYWAVGQILRELAGIRDEHSAEEARARVEPRIAQLLGLSGGVSTAEETTRAIERFLAAQAIERPLLVLADDVHWAEPALLELLAGLPAAIGDAPMLVVCLARPELLESRPEWEVTVQLEPLGARDVDALLESLAAPAAVRARLAQAAAGNPLFAEELVAWVREGGDVDDLPTSLNALLGARLDRLDAGARDALERGAVEGELFHRGAVVELSDPESRPSVPSQLEALAGKDLVRPAVASFASEAAFRFKHILVRDAAYRATAKKLRASLHEHFADWLERLVGERVGEYQEILGYHFEQAYRYRTELGPVDDDARSRAAGAARHLGGAGGRENDRGDVHAAANLLGRATALLPANSLERLKLLLPYGYSLRESGRVREAVANWDELDERATVLGERGLAAHARCSRAMEVLSADLEKDIDELRAITEEGLETFTELGDEAGLAKAKRGLGHICQIQGRRAEAAEWLEQALVHANICGDQVTRRTVTQSLATILSAGPMPAGAAIRRCEELRDANRDDRVLEAVITRCLSGLLAMTGQFDEAREYGRRSSRVLDETNMLSSWWTRTYAAYAKELAGDRTGAEQDLKERLLFFRQTRDGALDGREPFVAYRLAYFYCDDGRWDDAEECVASYRDVPDPNNSTTGLWDMRLAVLARLAGHRGEHAEAVRLAESAVERAKRTDDLNLEARIWLALAEVQRASGQTAEADAAVATALDLYEQKGNIAAAARLRTAAHEVASSA